MDSGKIQLLMHITSRRPPQCIRCIHYERNRRCRAFPQRNIPWDYLFEKVKHQITLGNQVGNYIYEARDDRYKQQDEEFKEIEDLAIFNFEKNKETLPALIIEELNKFGSSISSMDRLVVKASGPLRSRYDFQMEFYPPDKKVELNLENFSTTTWEILLGLGAKNLAPEFVLNIFNNGEYEYE